MTLIYSSGALGRSTTFVTCCDVSDENISSHNLSIWSKDEEKAKKKQHQNLEVPDPLLQWSLMSSLAFEYYTFHLNAGINVL